MEHLLMSVNCDYQPFILERDALRGTTFLHLAPGKQLAPHRAIVTIEHLWFLFCLFVCLTDSYCVLWLNFVTQAGLKLLAILLFQRLVLVAQVCHHLQLRCWDLVISESA